VEQNSPNRAINNPVKDTPSSFELLFIICPQKK
jgi:hypothetical protein